MQGRGSISGRASGFGSGRAQRKQASGMTRRRLFSSRESGAKPLSCCYHNLFPVSTWTGHSFADTAANLLVPPIAAVVVVHPLAHNDAICSACLDVRDQNMLRPAPPRSHACPASPSMRGPRQPYERSVFTTTPPCTSASKKQVSGPFGPGLGPRTYVVHRAFAMHWWQQSASPVVRLLPRSRWAPLMSVFGVMPPQLLLQAGGIGGGGGVTTVRRRYSCEGTAERRGNHGPWC